MGCGSSHSVPVTPEYGDHKERNLPKSPSTDDKLSVHEDVLVKDGGEGGDETRDGNKAEPLESERINVREIEERRRYGDDHAEDVRPTTGNRRTNGGILTDRRVLNEVQSPRNNSGRSKNLAFEVAAVDGGGDSLIKRHPPKKFQKLEEQHDDTNITQELLEEKQAIAEKRRKEILSQRVKSAKTTSAKSVQARARVAESKEVDQLIQDEERELQRPHSDTSHLPPLSMRYRTQAADSRDHRADTDSIHSHSTLSSAASTIVTPQQSAQYERRQQDLRKQFEEEYEALKQERDDDQPIESAKITSSEGGI